MMYCQKLHEVDSGHRTLSYGSVASGGLAKNRYSRGRDTCHLYLS